MPARHALTDTARGEIQTLLLAHVRPSQIAEIHHISERQVWGIKWKLKHFGTMAPDRQKFVKQGQPRTLTKEMEEDIINFLLKNKQAYADEIATFVFKEYDTLIHSTTITRLLKQLNITLKTASIIAAERDIRLRSA